MTQTAKKQTRGVETRERILSVTQKLISDHDYYSVTLDQIAEHAQVSKSSLLWHFESKELLFSEAACELFHDLEQAIKLEKDDSLSLDEKLQVLLEKVSEYFQDNPEPKGVLISLIFNSQIPPVIRERIEVYWENHIDVLVEFLSTGSKTFSRDAARTILDVMHGCYIHWYTNKEKEGFSTRLSKSFQYINFT